MKGSALMIEAAHSNAGDDDDQPFPPGPLARNVRLLKAAVSIMGVLLVVGTMVLVGAIIWKASRLPATTTTGTAGFEAFDIAVPAGSTVRSVEMDGDRMAVTIAGARDEIVVLDLRRGEVVGRIRLAPGEPAAAGATSP
jgi:hypothetical protein